MNEVNTTPTMSNEEKIIELEKRVAALEKIEKDRRTRKIIVICIKLFFYIALIIALIVMAFKLKSYFDQLNNIKNLGNNFNLNSDTLKDFDINNYLNGLFNY